MLSYIANTDLARIIETICKRKNILMVVAEDVNMLDQQGVLLVILLVRCFTVLVLLMGILY